MPESTEFHAPVIFRVQNAASNKSCSAKAAWFTGERSEGFEVLEHVDAFDRHPAFESHRVRLPSLCRKLGEGRAPQLPLFLSGDDVLRRDGPPFALGCCDPLQLGL